MQNARMLISQAAQLTTSLLKHELGSRRGIIAVGEMSNVDKPAFANLVIRMADDQGLALSTSYSSPVSRVPKRYHRADFHHRFSRQCVGSTADNQGALGVAGHDDFGVRAVGHGLIDEICPGSVTSDCFSLLRLPTTAFEWRETRRGGHLHARYTLCTICIEPSKSCRILDALECM
jgi:hypothetical protein